MTDTPPAEAPSPRAGARRHHVPPWTHLRLGGVQWGLNPGVNRPLVMAVVPPELRGMAFAIFVSVIESLGFAAYMLTAGFLADALGLQVVMLWLVVTVMLANGLFLTLLYRPFRRDRKALLRDLAHRRAILLAEDRV